MHICNVVLNAVIQLARHNHSRLTRLSLVNGDCMAIVMVNGDCMAIQAEQPPSMIQHVVTFGRNNCTVIKIIKMCSKSSLLQ